MAAPKVRVDHRVLELGLADTLDQAQRLILAGVVRCGDCVYDKPGHLLAADIALTLKDKRTHWVSRGGDKLREALDVFTVDPTGLTCLDVGASTGGFTHVLIERGAREVTALDVGYGILDWNLRNNPRVIPIERTNFRTLPPDFFPNPFDLVVIDVSFISLRMILPKAATVIKPEGMILALIKPQFEAAREDVAKGGKVTSPEVRAQVVTTLQSELMTAGLFLHGITGICKSEPGKNLEVFSHWRRSAPTPSVAVTDAAIRLAVQEPSEAP